MKISWMSSTLGIVRSRLRSWHDFEILCNVGEVYIFENGLYISEMKHPRMIVLGNKYVLLASINTIK